jgi:Rps23 Pro-64 3,4-dihydroxylase Tpa1-like proline 4-hydroxylase
MLNPAIDVEACAAEYGRRGRIFIREAFSGDTVERLEHCLREEVPWGLATRIEGEPRALQAGEMQTMAPDDWRRFLGAVQKEAREGYQFLYNTYMMVTAWKERRDPALYLHPFFEFLNSPAMLELARRVTGHADIAKADAQATRYLPGHFLRRHNDVHQSSESDSRRAAYVVNLTRDWQADWGGLLQFMDEEGRVTETWSPGYNGLALFEVPTWHCVSCVAPYATKPRLSITGWFRTH